VKLTNVFFVLLGAISYSLYLLHPVAISIIKYLIDTKQLVLGDAYLSIYLLICTPLSLFMIGLVYHFIEKLAIATGRYLRDRRISEPQNLPITNALYHLNAIIERFASLGDWALYFYPNIS
jgi:peptidoglycan/LPS O-acetylase OafA/YrhL